MKAAIITILVLVASGGRAHAQGVNFGVIEDGAHVATVTTGADYSLVVGAGYARVLSVAERPLVLHGDLTFALGDADLGELRLRVGALVPIASHGRWKVIAGLAPTLRSTSNAAAQMINLGADLGLLAGHYAPRWFAAAEVGFDWAIATHIAPTDDYRMVVYPDARSGWYGNTAGMIHYGIEAGITLGLNDVILRVGQLRDVAGAPAMFPIYGTLAYDRRW